MTHLEIIGAYKLKSFQIETLDGEVHPWGEEAHGLLIYTESGHMSVSINRKFQNNPDQHDAENLFDSILFYAGTYTIEGNLIRHHVTEATSPSRINREMLRYAEWKDGALHLATPEEPFGRAVLVWTKASGKTES